MAKLSPTSQSKAAASGSSGSSGGSGSSAERELRARIAELEALVEARTQTIIGLATQLAEHQGTSTTSAGRVAEAERQLAELQATKVIRYSAAPRRLYGQIRNARRG